MRLKTVFTGIIGLTGSLIMSTAAVAQEIGASELVKHQTRGVADLPWWWYLAPACSVIALIMAVYFYKDLMKASEGTDRMKEIAQYVREGALAYLKRQYKVVTVFFIVVCAILAFMAFGLGVQHKLVPFAFLTGGFFSGLAGFFGMKTATNASARTAQAASESLDRGLKIAFRAGSVMGLVVVGLALIDISAWFFYLFAIHHNVVGGTPMSLEVITVVMLCFGMGASSQALFARVGGGIYTKAADVGADLVGKVEAGIPEDDPRNPATIADNVGDNVGDVAGMGADLYESYCGSILATAALGVAAVAFGGSAVMDNFPGMTENQVALRYLSTPMMLAAVGIILSIIGIFLVSTKEGASMKQLMWALNKGIWGSSALVVVAAAVIIPLLGLSWGVFGAVVVGLVVGLIIGYGTEYFTSMEYKPTKAIAAQAETGTGPLIIGGLAEGMFSTWIPIVTVSIGMLLAFGMCNGFENLIMGLYGVGIAAVGMLSTLGITLATDAYGPIADNAGGNAEMAQLDPEVRKRTDALDSLGNTTAAIGKGFAIGSAALTALALLAAYVEEVRVGIHREMAAEYAYVESDAGQGYTAKLVANNKYALYIPGADKDASDSEKDHYTVSAFLGQGKNAINVKIGDENISLIVNQVGEAVKVSENQAVRTLTKNKAGLKDFMAFYEITLMNPKVLVGIFCGVLMVFVFSAMTMKAVGRAAMAMVMEVRRQFKEIPGIMEGEATPEYAKCVAISTAGAQKEMIIPSLMAVTVPILAGLILGVGGVMGLLVGGLCSGYAMAVFMANTGGAWDNAKKLIETGAHGGKGSEAHKCAVVGDAVGDPFKDTSGPSLNILIKLMNMVSIVFAGLIVKYAPQIGELLHIGG